MKNSNFWTARPILDYKSSFERAWRAEFNSFLQFDVASKRHKLSYKYWSEKLSSWRIFDCHRKKSAFLKAEFLIF